MEWCSVAVQCSTGGFVVTSFVQVKEVCRWSSPLEWRWRDTAADTLAAADVSSSTTVTSTVCWPISWIGMVRRLTLRPSRVCLCHLALKWCVMMICQSTTCPSTWEKVSESVISVLSLPSVSCPATKERKGKEEYLYSAFYILCISQSAEAWITQFYLQIHHACLSFVCAHRMAPPLTKVRDIQLQLTTHLSTRRDERLSWPGWLTYSGQPT